MRLAIINLTAGGMSGGYKKYLQNIIPRMAAHSDVQALLCAAPDSFSLQGLLEPLPNIQFINCKPYLFLGYGTDADLNRHLQEFRPDVIFVPTERYFQFNSVPVVRMLQNMEPLVTNIDGNPFEERVRLWLRAVDAGRAIKKSDRVIAISEFVRDFFLKHWNVPPERIGVVYHGSDMAKNEGQRPFLVPNDWEGRFLFTAGSIRPARGLEDALHALSHLFDLSSNIAGLVIAGDIASVMMRYKEKLEDWIKSHNLSSKVCWAGNLNEKEMAWCYKNCSAFVMTSRVEACPNIALEAMANGCVCISTDSPPMPEIFGNAAIYCAPKDGKALAEVIQTTLNWDERRRKEMSEKAKKRAAEFSWDACVEKTVMELAKAAKGRQSGGSNF